MIVNETAIHQKQTKFKLLLKALFLRGIILEGVNMLMILKWF